MSMRKTEADIVKSLVADSNAFLLAKSNEEFIRALDGIVHFHEFDVYQIGMILSQNPDASYVKTRAGWKKEMAFVCVPPTEGIFVYDETKHEIDTFYDDSQVEDADGRDSGALHAEFCYIPDGMSVEEKQKQNEKKLCEILKDEWEFEEYSTMNGLLRDIYEMEYYGIGKENTPFAEAVEQSLIYTFRERFHCKKCVPEFDFMQLSQNERYRILCEIREILCDMVVRIKENLW